MKFVSRYNYLRKIMYLHLRLTAEVSDPHPIFSPNLTHPTHISDVFFVIPLSSLFGSFSFSTSQRIMWLEILLCTWLNRIQVFILKEVNSLE
jgi:hypothetical protein